MQVAQTNVIQVSGTMAKVVALAQISWCDILMQTMIKKIITQIIKKPSKLFSLQVYLY